MATNPEARMWIEVRYALESLRIPHARLQTISPGVPDLVLDLSEYPCGGNFFLEMKVVDIGVDKSIKAPHLTDGQVAFLNMFRGALIFKCRQKHPRRKPFWVHAFYDQRDLSGYKTGITVYVHVVYSSAIECLTSLVGRA